jgi:hypothetical protein
LRSPGLLWLDWLDLERWAQSLGQCRRHVQMSPMPRFVGGKSLEEQFGTLWWIARALFQTDSVSTEVRYSRQHCIGYKRNFKEKLI